MADDRLYEMYAIWDEWPKPQPRVRVNLHPRLSPNGAASGKITVEQYYESTGMWMVPYGWDEEITMQASETFLWSGIAQNFYSQLARFLEVVLYTQGSLSIDMQQMIKDMTTDDMQATAKAFEVGVESPFPKKGAS